MVNSKHFSDYAHKEVIDISLKKREKKKVLKNPLAY